MLGEGRLRGQSTRCAMFCWRVTLWIAITLISETHLALASSRCESYLRTEAHLRLDMEDSLLLLQKLRHGKNEIDFLQSLPPEVKATAVRFTPLEALIKQRQSIRAPSI